MIADRPVFVAIPTIGYSPYLIPLVNELERDKAVDQILLTVNIADHVEPVQDFFRFAEPTVEIVETWPQGKSLYHGWNFAIEAARKEDAWLAVLNDDIRLFEPNAISHVAGLLASHPSYAIVGLNWQETPESADYSARPLRQTHGTYRHGGAGGWAWVCDPHKVVTVPDEIVWWYGDDHIFLSAEKDGHKVGIANHVHVEHYNEFTASSPEQDWTQTAKITDHEAFRRIWPEE